MSLLLFIRLLFLCNLLHVGEPFKCTTSENKNLRARSRWSPWTDWSPCTRPCGIGIQERNRTCLLTRRKRRKNCSGSTTSVRICNTHDCPDDRPDLLSEQCSAFNNRTFAGKTYTWLPFIHLGRECSLHCRPQGERFFAELSPQVVDGTPCGKNSYCYKGRCLEAVCNNVLGLDSRSGCEMCNGRNTSYPQITGLFTLPNLGFGYYYITTIPSFAINITISQLQSSNNHLECNHVPKEVALRKKDGSYILNGNWNINQPGYYACCGTAFNYHRGSDLSNSVKEYIQSAGPLQEPIQIMLVTTQVNLGIKYEYQVAVPDGVSMNMLDPMKDAAFQTKSTTIQHRVHHERNETINSIHPDHMFVSRRHHRKRHFTWMPCLKSCGDGIYRSIVCVRHPNEMIVPDNRCSTLEKPIKEDYRCNTTKICLPEWVPLEWSPCSTTCGEGLQRREVVCKQFTSTGNPISVHVEGCVSSPPLTVQKCNLKPCDSAIYSPENWEVGVWSECSSSCGPGIRTRNVICRSTSCYPNTAPPTREPCNSVCRPKVGIWLTSQWDIECSESCGSGWQMRNVICYGDGNCNRDERPEIYRACSSDESCSGQWFEGPWQKCTGICHSGEQKRDVLCIAKVHNQFRIVPDDKCSSKEKPAAVQRCQLPKCSAMWYTTNWSACTISCGGVQNREVFCIENNIESSSCTAVEKPPTSQHCNKNSCTNSIEGTAECENKYKHCQIAVQARLCVYEYYKTLCCRACNDNNKI